MQSQVTVEEANGLKAAKFGETCRQFANRMRTAADGIFIFRVDCDSPALQLYHEQIVKKNYLVYGFDLERPAYRNGPDLVVPPDIAERWNCFIGNGPKCSPVYAVLSREQKWRTVLEQSLGNFSITVDERTVTAVFHRMTSYAALLLDTLGAGVCEYVIGQFLTTKGLLNERIERNMALNHLRYPTCEKLYWSLLHDDLLKLSALACKGNLKEAAINAFIRNTGYLDRSDLEPCAFERPAFVGRYAEDMGKMYADWREPAVKRAELEAKHRLMRRNRVDCAAFILKHFSAEEQRDLRSYLYLLGRASDFNERNRMLRSDFLRRLQAWFEYRGRDPLSSALPEECGRTPSLQEARELLSRSN